MSAFCAREHVYFPKSNYSGHMTDFICILFIKIKQIQTIKMLVKGRIIRVSVKNALCSCLSSQPIVSTSSFYLL